MLIIGDENSGGHWFVALKRSGNSLYTAEGNFNSSIVRIGWNYTIDIANNKFTNDTRWFNKGFHYLGATPPPELTASWSGLGATNVGERNAKLEGQINFNLNTTVTGDGIRVYNSAGTQIAQKDENCSVPGTYCKIWFDVNSELGVSLSPGTNYSYKLYATAGGKTFWSDAVYFKTAGTSTYTISYDAAGGSGAPAAQTKEYGSDLTFPDTTPTRDGYVFLGWADSASAVEAAYVSGDSYTVSSAKTFYAVWMVDHGSCGDSANWNISGSTLHITGSGAMADYSAGTAPWYAVRGSIDTVIVDAGITRIGDYSFYALNKLKGNSTTSHGTMQTHISLPTTLTEIGAYAFSECRSISPEINLPNSLISIGQGAFENCWFLVSIVIPEKITYIGNDTFSSCICLRSIEIPAGVTEIGNRAFFGCVSLKNVAYPGSSSQWKNIKIGASNSSLTSATFLYGTKYDIAYDANGGEGAPAPVNKRYGQSFQLSETVPTRTGYRFLGWSESQNATTAEYQPGDDFTGNRDTVFYAVWAYGPEVTVNVSGNTVTVDFVDAEPGGLVVLALYKNAKSADIQIVDWEGSPVAFTVSADYNSGKVMLLDSSYRPLSDAD